MAYKSGARKAALEMVLWWADEIPAQTPNIETLACFSEDDSLFSSDAVADAIAEHLRKNASRIVRKALSVEGG